MITCRYILDDVGNSVVSIFPNEAINVTYEELSVGKPPINYISLDGLGVDLLDDTSVFASGWGDDISPYYCGYISGDVSDENGNINDWISIFGAYTDMPEINEDLVIEHGLTINFFKGFASEIEIYAYDNEDTKVYSGAFVVDKEDNFFDLPKFVCNRMYIYFKKTNMPNSFVKIRTFALGKIHEINSFSSFDLQDEKDLLGSDLPMGQIEFKTNSKENLIGHQGNTFAFFDDSELLGWYYLNNVEKTSKETYDFVVQNLLYKLNKTIYNNYGVTDDIWSFENVNAYDELVKLFEYCNVKYEIDNSFKNVWLTPYIPEGKTARFVLQQICFAIGAEINCWKQDYISVSPRDYYSLTGETLSNFNNVIVNTKINKFDETFGAKWTPKVLKITDEEFRLNIIGDPENQISPHYVRVDFNKKVNITNYQGEFVLYKLQPNYMVVAVTGEQLDLYGKVLTEADYEKNIQISLNNNHLDISNVNVVGFKDEFGSISKDETIKTIDVIDDYVEKFSGRVLSATIVYRGEKTGDKITIQANDDLYYTGIISHLSFNSPNDYRTAKIEVELWRS